MKQNGSAHNRIARPTLQFRSEEVLTPLLDLPLKFNTKQNSTFYFCSVERINLMTKVHYPHHKAFRLMLRIRPWPS